MDIRHVLHGDPLGDAHHERDPGVGRFEDGLGRASWWNEDHRRVRSDLAHRIDDGVVYRDALDVLSGFAGRDPSDDPGPVRTVPKRVERALLARDALHDDRRIGTDEDAHWCTL